MCVGRRHNAHGTRLLLQVDDEMVWSVPPQWTDCVALDPAILIGNERAYFRLDDLLQLEALTLNLGEPAHDECHSEP